MKCNNCGKEIGDIPFSNTFYKCPHCNKEVNYIGVESIGG